MIDTKYYYWITSTKKTGNGINAYEGLFYDTLDAIAEVVVQNEGNSSIQITFMKISATKVRPNTRFWTLLDRTRDDSRTRHASQNVKELIATRFNAKWTMKQARKRNYERPYGTRRNSTMKLLNGLEMSEKLRNVSDFVKKAWVNTVTINS